MPVDGRFEHIALSCNILSDHAIVLIERESQRAVDVSFELFVLVIKFQTFCWQWSINHENDIIANF